MRVGKTEVILFHGLPSIWGEQAFHNWDAIAREARSDLPEVAVGTSSLEDC